MTGAQRRIWAVGTAGAGGVAWRYGANDGGAVLATRLVLMAVLTLLGTAAVVTGIVDTKIGANYTSSMQAFYAAEAGLAEARERLRGSPGGQHMPVTPAVPPWKAYLVGGAPSLAVARQNATLLGYATQQHTLHTSLQSALAYTVVLEPAAGLAGHLQMTSYGATGSATKTLQIIAAPPPALSPPAALYLETPTVIQGMTTDITGMDRCGSDHKPAVLTPLGAVAAGLPTVQALENPTLQGTFDIVYHGTALDIPSAVDALRPHANFAYTVHAATHTATTTPGPGDQWGQPSLGTTPQDPSTCATANVVHYQTAGTSVTLRDGVSGCGVLLVEGDLEIQQDFSWYGLILVTGTLTMTASGSHVQQITGAVIAGGTVGANTIGGPSHLVYCSAATPLRHLPWRVLTWREVY